MEGSKSAPLFKVAIIGSHRIRVAKVLSLLLTTTDNTNDVQASSTVEPTAAPLSTVTQNNNDDDDDDNVQTNAILRDSVEYIPCVATFDSYENNDGEVIRYLAKIEHHDDNATQVRGSSLAPFFDDVGAGDDSNNDPDVSIIGTTTTATPPLVVVRRIPGLAAVAIGCGIETEEDIAMILTFLQSMSVHKKVVRRKSKEEKLDEQNSTIVQVIQPNAEYESMTEENDVYKQMPREDKVHATVTRTIGPGKMATFVQSIAKEIGIVHHIIPSSAAALSSPSNDDDAQEEDSEKIPILIEHNDNDASTKKDQNKHHHVKHVVPNDKTQFACKRCRTLLFTEHDLEDPPHTKAQQTFNRNNRNTISSSSCNSAFLAEGLDWMGDISTSMEGKLCCPKCTTKLGLWKWAGTQCSCGTWITPAIQINLGRVDVISPDDCCHGGSSGMAGLPLGTVMPKVATITSDSSVDIGSLSMAGLHIDNGS